MVIWLIGMSGAGKTAIGRELWRQLKLARPATVFLDGDEIREVFADDLGFTLEDRRANAGRICRLCRLLDRQGVDVVCSILSLFPESRAWNRAHLTDYFEVYVRVSFEELVRRDPKGLYRRALAGEARNVVGVDIPFVPPEDPDLVLDNERPVESFGTLAARVLRAVEAKRP